MITSQQISRYYEEYGEQEVTFTRQVSQILRLLPKFVYLKCQADTLPCIIYSSSLREAKVHRQPARSSRCACCSRPAVR